jgi:hypothetical protein
MLEGYFLDTNLLVLLVVGSEDTDLETISEPASHHRVVPAEAGIHGPRNQFTGNGAEATSIRMFL